MKKQRKNQFVEKFHFLNSQESSEEITWSYSDSSDYEDQVQCDKLKNITNCNTRRKRKRSNSKKDLNTSNLDITIVETAQEPKRIRQKERSPIVICNSKSPLLTSSPRIVPEFKNNPLITSNNDNHVMTAIRTTSTSPVIHLKRESTKVSPNMKKKLFETHNLNDRRNKENISSYINNKSPVTFNKDHLDKKKYGKSNIPHCQLKYCLKNDSDDRTNESLNKVQSILNLKIDHKEYSDFGEICISSSSSSENSVTNIKKSQTDLVAKVKTYFENSFTSQGTQHSISEYETPTPDNSSKNSHDVDIINPVTQLPSLKSSLEDSATFTRLENHVNKSSKKQRHKKGSLGYRLNALLKKQNSYISLWSHERYLAANSNFVIPKAIYLAFRIRNVDFKFSIFLLDVVDSNGQQFLVPINNIYVNSNNNNCFEIDGILKVYEPYQIINFNSDSKILINVCKFECTKLKLQ